MHLFLKLTLLFLAILPLQAASLSTDTRCGIRRGSPIVPTEYAPCPATFVEDTEVFGRAEHSAMATPAASYGRVEATSQANLDSFYEGNTQVFAEGNASFSDEILIVGGSSDLTLELVALAQGFICNPCLDSQAELASGAVKLGDAEQVLPLDPQTEDIYSPLYVRLTAPVQTGSATPFGARIQAAVGAFSSVSYTADWGRITIQSLRALNADDDAVTGLRYSTGSGASYNFVGATLVPEPGSLSLAAAGAAGLLLLTIRRYRLGLRARGRSGL